MSPAKPAPAASRHVLVVDRDEHRGPLLVRFLARHGFEPELVVDGRRVIRRCRRGGVTPPIVLMIGRDDPEAFELLGALAAHAIVAPTVVCARRDLDFRALPVHRALPEDCRFSLVAEALADLQEGRVVADAAE